MAHGKWSLSGIFFPAGPGLLATSPARSRNREKKISAQTMLDDSIFVAGCRTKEDVGHADYERAFSVCK